MKVDSSSRLIPSENAVRRLQVSVSVEHGTPSITVHIEGELRSLIIGTGSTVSILQQGVSKSDLSIKVLKPFGVTGEVLDIKWRQLVSLTMGGREFHHEFLVCTLPTEAAGILDTDFLVEYGVTMDLQSNKLSLRDVDLISCIGNETHTECTALTVFAEGKEGNSLNPTHGRYGARTRSSQPTLAKRKTRLKLGHG